MASGSARSWSVLCHVCNRSVDVYGAEDLQASLQSHYMRMHPSRKKPQGQPQPERRQYNNMHSTDNNCFCPVCKEKVVILNNDFTRSMQDHFRTHHQASARPRSDEQLYTSNGIKNWLETSDKPKDVFRGNPKTQHSPRDMLSGLPVNLQQHTGYITDNGEYVFCDVCCIRMDSVSSIHEHLKTKTHEDNIILHLKGKLPSHLHSMMEFISFYGSNLCCNLCRCKIELNSKNSSETILNILFHNADVSHSSKRSNGNAGSQSDIASSVLNSVANRNPLINENKHLIQSFVEPHFKCKVCNANIFYNNNEHILAKNLVTHLNSSSHGIRCEAKRVLTSFESISFNWQGRHKFVITGNGNIFCVPCRCNIKTDVDFLLSHVNQAPQFHIDKSNSSNTIRQFSNESSSSSHSARHFTDEPPRNFKSNKNHDPEMKRWVSCDSITNDSKQPQAKPVKMSNRAKKRNLRHLLNPLEREFGNINYITQNEQGQLACLICDCTMPPTTQSIQIHLLGNNHKSKIDSQVEGLNDISTNKCSGGYEASSDLTIDQIFQTLPQRLQNDKVFIYNSSVEGYFECSLCTCVINPHYLRDHLLDKKHVEEKQLQCKLF